jgi:hypothetical protein
MGEDIERFVASLAIPDDRKAVVLAELKDHAACAAETARREGRDPEAAQRAAVGDLEALRRSLEAVEPAFRITRWHSLLRGIVGGVVVAIVIDQLQDFMMGSVAALVALAIGVVCAPPRLREMLRAELRAKGVRSRLGRSVPIGPAITYVFTVMCTPALVWLGMIFVRALAGTITSVHAPWSAFVLQTACWVLLLVEGLRARRKAIA